MGANLLAGVSALAAGWLAQRIGLVNTMVFTHLPSNVLLFLLSIVERDLQDARGRISADWQFGLPVRPGIHNCRTGSVIRPSFRITE